MADKYVMSLYGGQDQQFDNVFKPNARNQHTGNRLMPLHNMTGGKRNRTRAMKKNRNKNKNSHRRRKNNKANKKNSKSKKGGYWGEVVKQPLVRPTFWPHVELDGFGFAFEWEKWKRAPETYRFDPTLYGDKYTKDVGD